MDSQPDGLRHGAGKRLEMPDKNHELEGDIDRLEKDNNGQGRTDAHMHRWMERLPDGRIIIMEGEMEILEGEGNTGRRMTDGWTD